MTGDLLVDTDSAYDLGSTTKFWANIFSDTVYFNATAYFSGATAGLAKLTGKLNLISGALLETPVTGTLEFYNNRFYITNKGKQKAIDRTSDVALATVTVTNTTEETVIWTGDMPANSVVAGNVFRFIADGTINTGAAADTVTIRVKVGANTMVTLVSEAKNITDGCWHLRANATQRTVGVSGQRAMHLDLVIDDYLTELCAIGTVNTTTSMDITVTAQWSAAKEENVFTLLQGFMGYRN